MEIWGSFCEYAFCYYIYRFKILPAVFALIITVFSLVKILSPLVYEPILICIQLWAPCSILKIENNRDGGRRKLFFRCEDSNS